MTQHRVKRASRKPNFFWQGVLILAPMLVLAKLGALALSQDRRAAEQDAAQRAAEFAVQAADEILAELHSFQQVTTNPVVMFRGGWWPSTNSGIIKQLDPDAETLRIEIDSQGWLRWPPPYEEAPLPRPLDISSLNETQRLLWNTLQNSDSSSTNDLHSFLASSPPSPFGVAACFVRGEALLRRGGLEDLTAAESCFDLATNRFAQELLESGLPARSLAIFKKHLTRQAQSNLASNRRGDIVTEYRDTLGLLLEQPVAVTPGLLRHLAALTNVPPLDYRRASTRTLYTEKARHAWEQQEKARKIFALARSHWELPTVAKLSGTSVAPLSLRPMAPNLFWIALRQDSSASPPLGRKYIESPPSWAKEQREPEPPALTPVWSNAMAAEAVERSRRLSSNNIHVHASTFALTESENWLLVRATNSSGVTIFSRPAHNVEKRIAGVLQRIRKPEYLDASIRVAGVDVIASNRLEIVRRIDGSKGAGQHWKREHPAQPPGILATSTRGVTEQGQPLLAVHAHLISPEMLYAKQEERAILFKLLIGASAIASIIGFFTAWRAFRKQLRLAEMKSNFVSSVSHELRAPIASVRLMAEGLERGKISDPAKQHEYFRFITQECRRLSAMIENVLDFARIEQGRKEYEFEPTDVTALVTTTVKLMEPYAEERGVKLKIEDQSGASAPPAVVIDGQAMQQALVNLLDNAIKHSPAGSEVVVSLALNPQLSTLNLSVSDSGPGIPATEHEKIFERFYRLGSELRRETPGVGIGLSIVKHIVDAHGGHVRVESEVGKGSRFTIELPLNATDSEAQKNESTFEIH